MDEFLKEGGLEYAKSLPAALGGLATILVLLLWGAYKAHEQESNGLALLLGIIAIVAGLQLPIAIEDARTYCRGQLIRLPAPKLDIGLPQTQLPESPRGFSPVLYKDEKCRSAFPNGP